MKTHTVVLYTLTGALLVLGGFLRAPSVCISSAVLFCTLSGIEVAEKVLNQKNKDAEISGLILRMEKIEKENKNLSMEISNVAERAKTVLGEVY